MGRRVDWQAVHDNMRSNGLCGYTPDGQRHCGKPADHLELQHAYLPETMTRSVSFDDDVQETVDHPKHYNDHPSGIECIDVVEHMSFNVGNAIKYLWRAGQKADMDEDFRKAIWYIERERKRLKEMTAP